MKKIFLAAAFALISLAISCPKTYAAINIGTPIDLIGQNVVSADLDPHHAVVISNGKARIATIDGVEISLGPEFAIGTAVEESTVAALDNTHFVVIYSTGLYVGAKAKIGTISCDNITFGPEYSFLSNPYWGGPFEISSLDPAHFIVAYGTLRELGGFNHEYSARTVAATVSGNAITFGSDVYFCPAAVNDNAFAAGFISTLDSTHFILGYQCSAGIESANAYAIKGTVSGNTVSLGSAFLIDNIRNLTGVAVNSNKFLTAYSVINTYGVGSSNLYMKTGTISGSTITWGPQSLSFKYRNSPNGFNIDADMLRTDYFALSAKASSITESPEIIIGKIDTGNNISNIESSTVPETYLGEVSVTAMGFPTPKFLGNYDGGGLSESGIVAAEYDGGGITSGIPDDCSYLYDGIMKNCDSLCGNPEYDPVFDINKDKHIDWTDLELVYDNINNGVWCADKKADLTDPCPVCGNGVCEEDEGCAGDTSSCPEPAVCYQKVCNDGCNNPAAAIASGAQDNEGINLCDNATGCASPPCDCDGSGNCITSTTPVPADCTYLYNGVTAAYDAKCGDASYNPIFDFDKDGDIDYTDLGDVSGHSSDAAWCATQINSTASPCDHGPEPNTVSCLGVEITPEKTFAYGEEGNEKYIAYDGLVPCGKCVLKDVVVDENNNYVSGGTPVNMDCQFCHFFVMLDKAINFLITLAFAIAALMAAVGGIMFLMGGANPGMLMRGKKILLSVAIGLAIMLAAYVIVSFILTFPGILKMTPNWNPAEWFQVDCKIRI